jgi:FkbM family methyltransferase
MAGTWLFKRFSVESDVLQWTRSPGGDLRVALNDLVGRCVYFFGDYDRKITWILQRLLKPGDNVVDAGANIGLVTLWMARLVGPAGRVYSFEPNPLLFGSLNESIGSNGYRNVSTFCFALGSEQSERELRVPLGNAGGGSIVLPIADATRRFTVKVHALDECLDDIKSLSLLKLDLEGGEYDALRGAQSILSEFQPVILFEATEVQSQEAISMLRDLGYEFLSIQRSFLAVRTEPLSSNRTNTHDVLAAPRTKFRWMCQRLKVDSVAGNGAQ